MTARLRRTRRVATSALLALLTLAGIAAGGVATTLSQTGSPRGPGRGPDAAPLPTSRPSSNGPFVVAVALGASGTVGSDALAPYEVFASSPRFSVYSVAATAGPAPVDGGPAIVPTFTFDDTRHGRAPRPDVVVVPAVSDPGGGSEAALREWVTEQARRGAIVLGVCAGSRLLAATGLLDGRTATSHWSRLAALRSSRPQVDWVDGVRYVQDGAITTTAGITSGIPGALRIMTDLAGPDEAARVGAVVGYPGWSVDAPVEIPVQSFSAADWPVGLNAVLPWGRPTLGVALADGMGEIDIASTFEVYDVSYAARPVPLSDTGVVTTRHGMVLVTDTADDGAAPARLVVPGARGAAGLGAGLSAWAARAGVPLEPVHGSGRTGFDGALEYLAGREGRATAVSAAKMVDYPTAHLGLQGNPRPDRVMTLGVLALGLAAAAAALPTLVRHGRHGRHGRNRRVRTAG